MEPAERNSPQEEGLCSPPNDKDGIQELPIERLVHESNQESLRAQYLRSQQRSENLALYPNETKSERLLVFVVMAIRQKIR